MKELNDRKLLLLDGMGAIISTIMLGIVLVHWRAFIGVSNSTLYLLAGIAAFFVCHSFYGYFQARESYKRFLKRVAFFNLAYCALTTIVLFYNHADITIYGWIYFILEIIIIISLSAWELKYTE